MPASWGQGPRNLLREEASAAVSFEEPIVELREVCRQAAAAQAKRALIHPINTWPVNGLCWRLYWWCDWDEAAQGVRLMLVAAPLNCPPPMCARYDLMITTRGGDGQPRALTLRDVFVGHGGSGIALVQLAPMAGGWDEAVWVAAGFPAEGSTHLSLTVQPHQQR